MPIWAKEVSHFEGRCRILLDCGDYECHPFHGSTRRARNQCTYNHYEAKMHDLFLKMEDAKWLRSLEI